MSHFDLNVLAGWFWQSIPVLLGGVGGYAFYRFIGCRTGSCPITSNPWLSILYGAFLGFLLMPR